MNTTIIGLKNFRQNISHLAKQAKKNNESFLVTIRNKPYFEIKPCYNENIDFDDVQIDYYKTLETGLGFWLSNEDENIFKC